MKPTHDVFVSYSSQDKAWADATCNVLEGNGVRCWIAPRDVPPGTEWGEEIIKGINGCRVMVLIFSKNANDSPQVRREVERAISGGVIVLPVRFEDVRPQGAMEFALGNTHWLDIFTAPLENHLELIARSVLGLLGKAPSNRSNRITTVTPAAIAPETSRPAKSALPNWVMIAASVLITALLFTGVLILVTRQSATPAVVPSDPVVAQVSATTKPTEPPTQEALLQGRWKVVEFTSSPDPAPTTKAQGKTQKMKERALSTTWQFLGDQLIVSIIKDGEDSVVNTGKFTVGRGRFGRVFDFYGKTVDGNAMGFAGIYELDGDMMKVAYTYLNDPANQSRSEERPKSFDVKFSGWRGWVYRFKRIGN